MDLMLYPKEWLTVECSDYVLDAKSDIVDGPFGSNLKATEYQDEGVPIVRIQNVKRFNFIDKNIRYLTVEKSEELARHSFKAGDILITKLGEPLGLACEVPTSYEYGIIVADLVRMRPNISVCSTSFLIYLLNSEVVIKQIKAHVKGTTRARINLSVIRELKLPLPPLAEQKIIADKLDTLLAQVESIKARLERITEILKQFRQSVLAAAVSGKLTEEWREEQQLVNWATTTLDSLILESANGLSKRTGVSGDEVTILRLADFKDAGRVHGNERVIKLDEKEKKKYALEKGDILIIRVNGSVDLAGRFIEYTPCDKMEGFCDHFIRIRLDTSRVNSTYLTYVANYGDGRHYLKNSLSTSAGQNTINQGSIKGLKLLLPSIQEQELIVSRVSDLFQYTVVIEEQVQSAFDRVNNLTQSILAKAFRGELTAGWREANTDLISVENSAEALLERIKAERSAKHAPKRGRDKA